MWSEKLKGRISNYVWNDNIKMDDKKYYAEL
jgi:hypothetical protein